MNVRRESPTRREIPPNSLREVRTKKLLTQRELAKLSGLTQVTISFIENGLADPMDLTKAKLAKALGVSVKTLFPHGRP